MRIGERVSYAIEDLRKLSDKDKPLNNVIGFMLALIFPISLIPIWISKMNKHFERTKEFYKTLVEYLIVKGYKESSELEIIRDKLDEMEVYERPRSPWAWLIIGLIIIIGAVPVIGTIYTALALGNVNKDLFEHEGREVRIRKALNRLMDKMGKERAAFVPQVERRNTFVYLMLSFLTAGLFAYYWLYAINADMNRHFKEHELKEKKLIEALEAD